MSRTSCATLSPMPPSVRLQGIRGATTVARNDSAEIVAAPEELLRTPLEANELQPDDIVSGLFTVTRDLDAAFPARAAEEFGWNIVALLHAPEIPVPGPPPRRPALSRAASASWCTRIPPEAGRKSSTATCAEPPCCAPTGREPGRSPGH